MALPLGKLTILVGAGILGSVLAQEGRASKVSDFFSGALKIVFKHVQQDDSPKNVKPQNDSVLLAQVNSLRQELQMLASSRSVTIITGTRSGATTYGVPVVVVIVVGYGYIWWKGWKLSDMMFATRRSLSDACTTVAKQLEQVHSSLSEARKHLTSRINRVDSNINECKELTEATRDEVAQLHGDLRDFGTDVESVQRAVQTLETKIGRLEEKQDLTNVGVYRLCGFVQQLEQSKSVESIQAAPSSSASPALELPQRTTLALEPPSPSTSSQTPKVSRLLQTAPSGSGLKDLEGIASLIGSTADPLVSNGKPATVQPSAIVEPNGDGSSGSGWVGRKLTGISAAFLSRTYSATHSK